MAEAEILGPEEHDLSTGEILSPSKAADGGLVPHGATTAGDFINMIEDGQFAHDVRHDIGLMVGRMKELAEVTGNKQKGRVTIPNQ